MALHGAETTMKWLKVPIDDQAPTPLTFRAKEAAYMDSPLYVKRDNCEFMPESCTTALSYLGAYSQSQQLPRHLMHS